jgi:hypothetical protein
MCKHRHARVVRSADEYYFVRCERCGLTGPKTVLDPVAARERWREMFHAWDIEDYWSQSAETETHSDVLQDEFDEYAEDDMEVQDGESSEEEAEELEPGIPRVRTSQPAKNFVEAKVRAPIGNPNQNHEDLTARLVDYLF